MTTRTISNAPASYALARCAACGRYITLIGYENNYCVNGLFYCKDCHDRLIAEIEDRLNQMAIDCEIMDYKLEVDKLIDLVRKRKERGL